MDKAEEEFLDILDTALTKVDKKEEITKKEEEALNQNRFLLLGGDVCGIQKFIYNLTSEGTAKGLKGRSFHVQLLSETLSRYLLSRLGLSLPNLLYCEGGRFYILAPLSKEGSLTNIYKEIGEKLLSLHQEELYLVLNSIYLCPTDFSLQKMGEKWDELNRKLREKKKQKFSEILDVKYAEIFKNLDKGGDEVFCEICGSEKNVKEEEGVFKCWECMEFEKLARKLRDLKFLVVAKEVSQAAEYSYPLFKEFGTCYFLFSSNERLEKFLKGLAEKPIELYSINSTDFPFLNRGVDSGFKFLVTHSPLGEKGIKSLDDFTEESRGVKRWAALRMDVDNLGRIFSKGLEDKATISRISTLSSMLSLYFCGWIEKIVENNEKAYGIYSGGDDLFIVGSWDVLPEIAREIYQDFRDFTCQNQNITLCGGVYIAPSEKFPLYRVAKTAGDALDKKSKALPDKDGMTFLDVGVKWSEFENEVKIRDKIIRARNKGVSRGLLYALSETIFTEHELKEKGRVPIWRIWKFFYTIRRFMERHRNAQEELLSLEEDFRPWFKDKPKYYGAAAIRWAELLTRKEETWLQRNWSK